MFKGLILTTLISAINVAPIATYRPTLYDLDYPQAELNNYTLRQVFEEQVLPLPVDENEYSYQLPDGTTFYGTDSGYYVQQIDDYTLVNSIPNSDLTLDSNDDNIPDNFLYQNGIIDISLTNGIATFTPTIQYTSFMSINTNSFTIDDTYYIFASFKSSSSSVRLHTDNPTIFLTHSGSNQFEYHSFITKKTSTIDSIYIMDIRSSDWTPIEVDYMGAINLTAIFGAGNEPDKAQMDLWLNNTNISNLNVRYHANTNIQLFALADKYSPMFDTTWNNLSDEQIDLQIQDYIITNYHNLDFDNIGLLTDSQINYWYDHYQTLKWYEFNDIPVGNQININSDIVILLIGLTLFIVGYLLAWRTGHSWLYAISGLLWFIPIAIIDNMWIIIFSIVMIIFSAILAFMKKE